MAIITQYHKDTDTTYVYESISYWDPKKQQSRSKRRVIGKIDPETGDTIPTGKRGRKKARTPDNTDKAIEELNRELARVRAELAELKTSNSKLSSSLRQERKEKEHLLSVLRKIQSVTNGALS